MLKIFYENIRALAFRKRTSSKQQSNMKYCKKDRITEKHADNILEESQCVAASITILYKSFIPCI